jgi:hypothetical protein
VQIQWLDAYINHDGGSQTQMAFLLTSMVRQDHVEAGGGEEQSSGVRHDRLVCFHWFGKKIDGMGLLFMDKAR